ncbi:MAG: hypothetical protein LBK66_00440 [Spirochaetaceae bacterium]|nr:hypothetical protein [Spirochaetaceae bacterium]
MAVKLALFCFLPVLGVNAQDLPPRVDAVGFPFARNTALGGAHVGLDGDFSSIFTNPAALVGAAPRKNYAELAIDIIDIDLITHMMTTDDPLSEFASLLVDNFEADLDIGGPLALGAVGSDNRYGYGWGLFNVSRFGLSWNREQMLMISATLTEEFTLAGAYGLRLYDGLDAKFDLGITAKTFLRAGYRSSPLFIQQIKYILQDLLEMPFETQLGAGFDIGFRWTLVDSLSFAAVLYDPFSPVWVNQYSEMGKISAQETIASGRMSVRPRASAGVSWKMLSPFWHRYFNDITLSVDYLGLLENLSENPRDPLLNISAGCEIRMLKVFWLRAGFKDMQPAGGIGINFTFMNVDVSVYRKELGTRPNQYVTWAASVNISFRD